MAADPVNGLGLQNFSVVADLLGILAEPLIILFVFIVLLEEPSSGPNGASRSVVKLQLVVVEHNWLDMLFLLVFYLDLKTEGISSKLFLKDGDVHIRLFICCCDLLDSQGWQALEFVKNTHTEAFLKVFLLGLGDNSFVVNWGDVASLEDILAQLLAVVDLAWPSDDNCWCGDLIDVDRISSKVVEFISVILVSRVFKVEVSCCVELLLAKLDLVLVVDKD